MSTNWLPNIPKVLAMRAAPVTPVTCTEFTFEAVPGVITPCRLYYATSEPPANPGPEPIAPVNRSGYGNIELVTKYARNTAIYLKEKEIYDERLKSFNSYIEEHSLAPNLIFTHGRGSTLGHHPSVAFSEGFARTQVLLAFECKLENIERATVFRSLLNHHYGYGKTDVAFGGRSKGAHASAGAANYTHVKKLILFTFPLRRGLQDRAEELLALDANTHILFISGDDDPLAVESILLEWRQRMRAKTWWIKLRQGDHALEYSIDPDPADRAYKICNVAGQLAAQWSIERDVNRTEMVIHWDPEERVALWTPWEERKPVPVPDRTQFLVNMLNPGMFGGGAALSFTLGP